jgi:pyridoxamine 5'-phosphate oxidase
MSDYFSKTRVEYTKGALDEHTVASSPTEQFRIWFEAALSTESNEPNACALATVDVDLQPSVRMVLLKSFDERGLVFFSNYNSIKGHQLTANGRAALVFYWPSIERQVRVEGGVARLSEQENDTYFYSRPRDSQFGSAVSKQSEVAASRAVIEAAMTELRSAVGDGKVPRPAHWGGYRIEPTMFEFWQGRENRLHDRVRYSRQSGGDWKIDRLWP